MTIKDRGEIRGLYLNPPDKGLIFCADEKSQMQALCLVCQEWIRAINDCMDNPFLWSASVERILEKVAKCKEPLDALH